MITTSPLEVRLRSDATRLPTDSPCILAHVMSESLLWGLGFTQALEARWPECAHIMAKLKAQRGNNVVLGEVLWTQISVNVTLAHLVAERSPGAPLSALDPNALDVCLGKVAERALATRAVVHAPPIGTGLAGARWREIVPMLQSRLVERGVRVVIHCLGGSLPI